jgi:hypothetical protein
VKLDALKIFAGAGYLTVGASRTHLFSATFDF